MNIITFLKKRKHFQILNIILISFFCCNWDFGTRPDYPTPHFLTTTNNDSFQAIFVEGGEPGNFHAKLTCWEKISGQWKRKGRIIDAVVGRNGITPADKKREGDGFTPAGIYRLGYAFGYAQYVSTRLNYKQATDNDFWVDDPQSPQYNQWVHSTPNARSFERLKRNDTLYKLAIVIEYNTTPVISGRGSAIFLHIWKDKNQPTSGCIAISAPDMQRLFRWLKTHDNPIISISLK